MGVEVMIYIYGAICFSMIIFNIVYGFLMRRSEPRMNKKIKRLQKKIDVQIENICAGKPVDSKHLNYLEHKCKHVNYLIAFNEILNIMIEKENVIFSQYLYQIRSVILYLAVSYQKKENMQAGYFSYFLIKYAKKTQLPIDSIQDILLKYVEKDNFYCRVNALDALYAYGNTDNVVEALKIQDDQKVFVHEKILTEGLLSFSGSHDELIAHLWKDFNQFSVHTQLAICNYIRFYSGKYKKEMLEILQDERQDKELRLSAIRYFGKYTDDSALKILLAFAKDKDPAHWEYANVAVSSLARYSGQEVVDTLKDALHSSNWYVRYSAAISLEAHHVDFSDLIDIVAGNDRYAREMLMYRLETAQLQKARG